jgi:Ni/Co efflux regulator RcnB
VHGEKLIEFLETNFYLTPSLNEAGNYKIQMKKMMLKITALSLFAAAMVAASASVRAQDTMSTNAPVVADQTSIQSTNAPVKHRKHDRLVFHGKLSAIDTNAMTLTVGERTFEITSETKITKDGQPATLSDGVVGEAVGGAYKKSADGTLTATSVHFGAKKKKPTNADSMGSTTNSVGN